MEAPSAGSVVLVPFPFSDLSESKLRPAVVLAEKHEEWSTGRKYLDMTEFRDWKEQANRPEPEPGDSTEREPVMAT